MIPASFIFVATLVYLFIPGPDPRESKIKRADKVQNYSAVSVNLHLIYPKTYKKVQTSGIPGVAKIPLKEDLKLPPEKFTEKPLEMESWMKDPKTWNIN